MNIIVSKLGQEVDDLQRQFSMKINQKTGAATEQTRERGTVMQASHGPGMD